MFISRLSSRAALWSASAAFVFSLTVSPAFAQAQSGGSKPAAPKAAAEKPADKKGPELIAGGGPQPDWVKACGNDPGNNNKESCITTRDLRSEAGQTLVSIGLREVKADKKKLLLVAVPPGVLLQPGMRINVDQNQPVAAKFSICFPNNCFAEADVSDAVLGQLKKGTNLLVRVFNQQGQEIGFVTKLDGFAKAYDGPPIDPKVVEEEQKRLQEELQKRAEEARKKLMEQSGQGAPKQ